MNDEEVKSEKQKEKSDEVPAIDLQAKCDEYLAGWKRALADYENLQKQNAHVRDDDRRRIRANIVRALLPVIDNFDSALKFFPDVTSCSEEFQKTFATWAQGVKYIEKQFAEALSELGVTPIATIGQQFDPHLHESGGARSEEGKKEHEIIEEVMKGWKIDDVVLRPAKVIVNELK